MVSFDCSREDHAIARKIAQRAHAFAVTMGTEHQHKTSEILMDIVAVHVNDHALRLQDLLETDNFNFVHDVFGIRRHLDRTTGRLDGHFLPRYAVPSRG